MRDFDSTHLEMQSILDGIDYPVVAIACGYRVLSANKAALELASGDAHAAYCFELSHHCNAPPSETETHRCPLHGAIATGAPVTVLHRHHDRNGKEILVEVTATPLRNTGGEVIGVVETAHDITTLKNAETELQAILETATDGFLLTDLEAHIIGCNDAYCAMSGYARDELLQLGVPDIEVQDAPEEIRQHTREIRQRGHARFESRHRRKDGTIFDAEISTSLVDFAGGRMVSFVRDITERKQADAYIRQLAYYDPLTGLPNRRLLGDRVMQALAQAQRFARRIALMFIDLDRFKQVNDTLGHKAGDELLKRVAERLSSCVREGDTVARTGGDEFVVVLTEIARPDDAALVAGKILEAMQPVVWLDGHSFDVTASIGIAICPVDSGSDGAELLRQADIAMYEAKASGGNTYRVYADPEAEGVPALCG